MAAMTLAEARARVLEHLDDPNNRRWSSAQVDSALRACLSSCMHDYNTNGGSRFVNEQSVTTSPSGTVSLIASLPIRVTGVLVVSGNMTYRLKGIRRRDRELVDSVSRTLVVETVTEYVLPTTTSHPLVGSGATAANTWPAFDEWVCLSAAQLADVKDNEVRRDLSNMADVFRSNVMRDVDPPRTRQWPSEGVWYDYVRWSWIPASNTLALHQAWL